MKKKIGIFIDHDLFIRNFLITKVFSSLDKKFDILYIFPDEKNRAGIRRRISKSILKKLNLKKKILTKVDFLRHKKLRYFHFISNFYYSRYKSGLDKNAFLYFQKKAINSRSFYFLLRFLSIKPIYFFISQIFKNFVLKDNIYLKNVIIENSIDIILHPTSWEGFFDSDLIDLGKKLNIPTIFLMNSWDNPNLSGMTHGYPDKYLVWGEKSKEYSLRYKKIPLKNIETIGSAQFTYNKTEKLINYKNIIKLKKSADFIVYAGSNMGINESDHLQIIDNYILKNNRNYKIVYRPHPWKQRSKNEEHINNYKFKNIILDPYSKKNYDELFLKKKNEGIIGSKFNESRTIINSSSGVFGPIGTLCLEACWLKKPIATYIPENKNELNDYMRYFVNAKHIQDFINDLSIPVVKNKFEIGLVLDKIYHQNKLHKQNILRFKKSQKYLDPKLNYSKKLFDIIKKIK